MIVDQDRMLSEFIELVKIKCSTKAEREVAEIVKAKLTALGLEVFEDSVGEILNGNCGNIFGYLRGNTAAPVLMLSAHLDSVEPCGGIEPVVREGIIYSQGDTVLGADDKAGVVAILEALRIIGERQIRHGDIQVVFTVAEEGGLSGSKCMDKSLLKADFGYVLDSGGTPGKIIDSAPGQNNITAVIYGKTAHAGFAPEEGINAIAVASKAIAQIRQGRIDFETTANVGMINGGKATNIVPDRVEIVSEARSRNSGKLEQQTKHMVETFEQVAAANGARADVRVDRIYDSYVLKAGMPVVELARRAAEKIGLEPVLEATGGGSDANYFNVYGIPSAVLAVGMSKVHTTEEYIKVEDLVKSAELVLSIIETAAKENALK